MGLEIISMKVKPKKGFDATIWPASRLSPGSGVLQEWKTGQPPYQNRSIPPGNPGLLI
jgi:hypothetical protein